ncbi:MAG: hypothetical protein OEN56_11795 [Gemmatimonadota bacterium]|nr:hypothetical protein [Gemmatimonadota bacterium]
MKTVSMALLTATLALVAGPRSLLAHGGHVGGHDGPLGAFHWLFESGAVTAGIALVVGLVAARMWRGRAGAKA